MKNTRNLFILLIFAYFFAPSVISSSIFENDFYIYSSYQSEGNMLAIAFGILFCSWLFTILPTRTVKPPLRIRKLTRIPFFSFSHRVFVVYVIVLIGFGIKLRMGGAGRNELLDGMDSFLLPGMSILLLCCSIYAVERASKIEFATLITLFFLCDGVYNGKIFSFLAIVLIFLRMDFHRYSRRTVRKIVSITFGVGIAMLLFIGLSRVILAGEDVAVNALGLTYLFGSEFLGVQASIGWAIDYAQGHLPPSFTSFGYALEENYIRNVGHGLATSPAAYFMGNFGTAGIPMALLTMTLLAILIRLARKQISWLAPLIIAINFQHFLRHGFDVFMAKITVQLMFLTILSFAYSSNTKPAAPRASMAQ